MACGACADFLVGGVGLLATNVPDAGARDAGDALEGEFDCEWRGGEGREGGREGRTRLIERLSQLLRFRAGCPACIPKQGKKKKIEGWEALYAPDQKHPAAKVATSCPLPSALHVSLLTGLPTICAAASPKAFPPPDMA
jgi:hypothetical protein